MVSKKSSTRVSVLIPVRNEEWNIATCLQHVYNSTHIPSEVIVYNDNSTDSTLSILRTLQNRYPNLKVLNGDSLPKGWAGKNHACHQLSVHATGDVLLFLDADTEIQPSCIEHLLNTVESERISDLVSTTTSNMDSWGEKMLMPFLPLTFLSWLPLDLFVVCHSHL